MLPLIDSGSEFHPYILRVGLRRIAVGWRGFLDWQPEGIQLASAGRLLDFALMAKTSRQGHHKRCHPSYQ